MRRTRHRSKLLAVVTTVALAAVACSSDDDTGENVTEVTQGASDETAAPPDTSGSDDTSPDDTAAPDDTGTPDTAAPDDTGTDTTDPPADDPANQNVGDEGEPVHGGELVYGIDSDTANAWAPYKASYASSGYVPLSAISDSLFAVTNEGEVVPLLVESYEVNDDYTEYTLQIREGINFHDGTPLTGAAVEFNLESCQYSALTGAAYTAMGEITSEGQTVTIATRNATPWVVLPAYLSYGSCGYMLSPDWLGSLADIPQRNEALPIYDAELAATPADGNPAEPVGLGAFVFESYTPGNGNSFRAVRNEDYWRGPNGITGEELPYLDAIEAVVAVDVDSRSNAVRDGGFDTMHTANADTIRQFLDDGELEVVSTDRYAEVGYLMINVAEGDLDPEGSNADNPLLVLPCRRALAAAIDLERLKEERGGGLTAVSNGPFPPGSPGHLEDSGYPKYDIDAAQGYMDECLAELGTDGFEFAFNTTNDPFNVETNTLIISMWQEAFGDAVSATITPIEQGQYIGLALFGTFEMFAWRNHGGSDPDTQRLWWHSASSAPIGQQALNFGRFRDEVIDEALIVAMTNPDPEARQEAAQTINRRFGEQVYNLWLTHSVWGIISQPYVNGIEANVLPDGTVGLELALAGRHQVNQIWCDEGTCD